MKKEIVDHYHSLLSDSVASETYGLMESMLKERKLFFGGRPLCIVLRPHFYTEQQFQYLKTETEVILGAFAKTHKAAMADSNVRAFFHMEPWEEEMIHVERSAQVPWSTSRLDSFYSLDHNTLSFIEYNAETPAGMAYEDVLAETFLDLPIMKKFQEKYAVKPFRVRGRLLDALLETYADWLGSRPAQKPQIAIVDWEDVPTKNEHRLCKEWFARHGVASELVDPLNLEYRNGKLYADDFRVDLIYKRVLGQELFQRMGSDNPIFRALRDRAVCISNSFQALILYKKSSLAFLSDEANHPLFTANEIRAIGEHIPWTRKVENRKTYYNNSTIDLMEFIEQNRARLVLKPNDSYGGKGVVLGWEASPENWANALDAAQNEPYVVQEKVNIASEQFPFFADGKMNLHKLYVDADPFIFMGKSAHGVLTRLSSEALLNVTAGTGSAVPSFLVSPK
jgi:uncharacterized circularly permuted ATP-grasp superfamily protein